MIVAIARLKGSAGRLKIYADWKAQRPKGTSRESVESIYVKIMWATCLSEELKQKRNVGVKLV